MRNIIIGIGLIISFILLYNSRTNGEEETVTSAPLVDSRVVVLSDKDFDKEIKTGLTVVDFWATWCAPCRIQGPIFERAANELKDVAVFAKLDIDKNRIVAGEYSISAVPTILIFKNGKVVKRLLGLQQQASLVQAVKSIE